MFKFLCQILGDIKLYNSRINNILASFDGSVKTIKNIHDYMEENIEEKLTIPFLSKEFNISPTYLKKRL